MSNYDSDSDSIELQFNLPKSCKSLPNFRKKTIQLLMNYLPFESSNVLELAVFEFTKKYIYANDIDNDYLKSVYSSKINDIHFNIQDESNNLLSNILNQKIELETIPYLQCNILNSQLWEPIIKKKEFIEYKKENMTTSDAYECRRCKVRKCKVFLLQTRSADEPMTVFIQCENCNSTFKIY